MEAYVPQLLNMAGWLVGLYVVGGIISLVLSIAVFVFIFRSFGKRNRW